MPTKHLPSNPSLDHLKYQAKDLIRAHTVRAIESAARLREFLPRFTNVSEEGILNATITLAEAQFVIAREYGFANWPRLKAYVESLGTARSHPFAGTWEAELSNDASQQTATLHVTVAENVVTITDVIRDAAGRQERNDNTLHADGQEHASGSGYVCVSRWVSPNILEAAVKKADQPVAQVRYEVLADGATLSISAFSKAHDGYPATEHRALFSRQRD